MSLRIQCHELQFLSYFSSLVIFAGEGGALNLQDQKMTDQIAGLENAGPGK